MTALPVLGAPEAIGGVGSCVPASPPSVLEEQAGWLVVSRASFVAEPETIVGL